METKIDFTDITSFLDSRGALKKMIMHSQLDTGRIEEVYVIYTGKGCVRGNHYHKITNEYFMVVSGEAVIALKDPAHPLILTTVTTDDSKVIRVPAGITHAFKNLLDQTLIILAVSTKEYDPADPDIFLQTILE